MLKKKLTQESKQKRKKLLVYGHQCKVSLSLCVSLAPVLLTNRGLFNDDIDSDVLR